MNTMFNQCKKGVMAAAVFLMLPIATLADDTGPDIEELEYQIELLKQQVEQMQRILEQVKQESISKEDVSEFVRKEDVAQLEKDVIDAAEWKNPNTLVHMAGYADAGYTNSQNDDGSFNVGSFSPIFHFQYRDLVMMEAELEFEVDDDGETETGLEYMTIDYFLNDYVALVAGKFLSPVGQFRQNLHPSWINKLPSAAPGFGHDGAAPTTDLGLQARGGFPLGNNVRANYAAYIGNGPELNSATEDGIEFELEGIRSDAFNKDRDGDKVVGGRFGLLPMAGLEIGVSGATGKAAVTKLENELTGEDESLADEDNRDYDVFGADFAWQFRGLDLRGEYVKSKIGSSKKGLTASGSANWKTWYTQAAYRLPTTKFEGVVRYTDFDSPVDSKDQEQWALGLNYIFAQNIIAKLGYEFNDNDTGSEADDDRWLVQMAYGF